MELTPFQRIAAFAVVVLVLAGLGAYLFLPRSSAATGGAGGGEPSRRHSPSPVPSQSSVSPVPSGQADPDIYQWLPFTKAALASAATATTEFATDYGTYSYTETTQAYLAPMRRLMSEQLGVVIGRAFQAPGLASSRSAAKQEATATDGILALRAFGPTSLTFVVAISQRITSNSGTRKQVTNYAVTLTGTGSSWQVNDIQLASAGNQ
ncbi:MAG: hypothetical protein LBV34_13300 [Nocardiopsaceae bacterium]|jgi:hypothetical protein|nr:hypothetical protein [Nocardiopsaceae bacterium]